MIALATWSELVTVQSLAEVAKKEEARRRSIPVRGRVYTNNDLKPEPVPATADAAPDSAAPNAKEEPARGEPSGDAQSAKGEAYWKGLIRNARAALDRSQVVAAALQSRMNALDRDIAARDDPAQRSQLEGDRRRVLRELERITLEIAEQTKAIALIEEDARKAGVPPGWLR